MRTAAGVQVLPDTGERSPATGVLRLRHQLRAGAGLRGGAGAVERRVRGRGVLAIRLRVLHRARPFQKQPGASSRCGGGGTAIIGDRCGSLEGEGDWD